MAPLLVLLDFHVLSIVGILGRLAFSLPWIWVLPVWHASFEENAAGSFSWRIRRTPPRGQRFQLLGDDMEDQPTWILNVLLASFKNKKLEGAWVPGPRKKVLRETNLEPTEQARDRMETAFLETCAPQRP